MRRARFVRSLPIRLQAFFCLVLIGHVRHVDPKSTRFALICEVCPHRSAGIDTHEGVPSRQLPGEARRFESYARRVRGPEPLDQDWYADEHFQGDHANAG